MTDHAIIDIGSNSIRYAEEAGGRLPRKEIFTTRLGSGLMRTGRLMDETMERSLSVLKELGARARAGGFVPRAYATSAVRDALNGHEFADRVGRECGIPVDILTGEQEARYAYLGAVGENAAGSAMLDIGGASMQVVTDEFGVSFPAGCVRCGDIVREALGVPDCDTDRAGQRAEVIRWMDSVWELPDLRFTRLVGVGGTITTLAALKAGLTEFSVEKVNAAVLAPDDVERLILRLAEMGGARKEHPLLRARHDVILYGAYIFHHAMELLGAEKACVSCSDGMEGYLKVISRENDR